MEGGPLAMSQKERMRLVMMNRVEEKAMTIKEAAEVMGIGYRQGRRIYRRYVTGGDKGANTSKPGQALEPKEALRVKRDGISPV